MQCACAVAHLAVTAAATSARAPRLRCESVRTEPLRLVQAIDAFLDYSTTDHEVTRLAYIAAIKERTIESINAFEAAANKAFHNASLRLHPDRHGGQCAQKKAKYDRIIQAREVIKADLDKHREIIEKGEQREKRGAKRRIELVRVGEDY